MGFNYFEAVSAMNATQVYHGTQLPSGMSLKVLMQAGATSLELRKCKISARVAMASNMIQRAQKEF